MKKDNYLFFKKNARGFLKTVLLPNIGVIGRLEFSHIGYILRLQPPSGLDLAQNPWFFKVLSKRKSLSPVHVFESYGCKT